MSGLTDLATLLNSMQPHLLPGRYVFATVPHLPTDAPVVACVREDEGLSVVVEQAAADRLGLGYDYVAAMITLRVHSSLHAVGLTAAVAQALAASGLSCNIVAGTHHDHLFVPHDQATRAVTVLERLSGAAPEQRTQPPPDGSGAPRPVIGRGAAIELREPERPR